MTVQIIRDLFDKGDIAPDHAIKQLDDYVKDIQSLGRTFDEGDIEDRRDAVKAARALQYLIRRRTAAEAQMSEPFDPDFESFAQQEWVKYSFEQWHVERNGEQVRPRAELATMLGTEDPFMWCPTIDPSLKMKGDPDYVPIYYYGDVAALWECFSAGFLTATKRSGNGKEVHAMPEYRFFCFLHRSSHAALMRQGFKLTDVGDWAVYGESEDNSPSSKTRGPLLGVVSGKLRNAIGWAVTQDKWMVWGGGGEIEAFVTKPPKIVKV
jgi:hypothetical protein